MSKYGLIYIVSNSEQKKIYLKLEKHPEALMRELKN